MKSKISFFNRGLFKSALRRFWPLWAMHFTGWFLFMPVLTLVNNLSTTHENTSFVFGVTNTAVTAAPIVAFIMAILTAMAVFGFMFNSRSTGLIASLPVRREAVFGSAWLGGMASVVVSNAVIALLTFLFSLGADVSAALVFKAVAIWFAVYSMQFTLFFGIACLTAVMTGSIVALPILYLIFSFLAVGMEAIVRMYLASLVWGMGGYTFSCVLDFLSPVVFFVGRSGMNVDYTYTPVTDSYGEMYTISRCVGVGYSMWTTLIAYCIVGIVFAAAALLIFRKRRMEAAGDVIAIVCLRPVFKYGVAACSALCGGLLLFVMLSALFGGDPMLSVFLMIPSMIVFAFVGYFGAKMLLKKSFHVFRGSWTGFIIMCFVCAAFVLACDLDVMNIGSYVPDADNVESLTVYSGGRIKNRAAIEEFVAFQKDLVADKDKYSHLSDSDDDSTTLMFEYELKNGKHITREYLVRADDENYTKYYTLTNMPEVLIERFTPKYPVDVNHITSSVLYFTYRDDSVALTPEQAANYYSGALMSDLRSGRKILWNDSREVVATVIIDLADDPGADDNWNGDELVIDLTTDCTASIKWVKDNLGIDLTLPEYSNTWDEPGTQTNEQ